MPARLGKDRKITEKAVRTVFIKSFLTTRRELFYPQVVQVHDSHVETDFAAMLGTVPQVVEVPDASSSPPVSDFVDFKVTWKNRLFKAIVSIGRDLFDFDQTGQVFTILHSMGARLANFPDRLLINRIVNGTDADVMPAWESASEPYFSTSHDISTAAGTQDNIVTGSTNLTFVRNTSPATVAQQLQADFRTALERMHGFKDDRGEPFHNDNIPPESLFILCSPALQKPMQIAFTAQILNQTTNNTFTNAIHKIVASNYLGTVFGNNADLSSWYLMHVAERVRPFKYSRFRQITDRQIEDKLNVNELSKVEGFDNLTMENLRALSSVELDTNMGNRGANSELDVILHERFFTSARWRGEIFGGEWRNCIKVSNT